MKVQTIKKFIKFGLFFWIINSYNFVLASTPQVVVTIKPVYALTAGIMEGIAKPYLLLQGTESPHNYNLRPSQAKKLYSTDLLVWVGPSVEVFLEKIVTSLSGKELRLLEINTLTLLKMRNSDVWDVDSDGHSHIDPHIWLDPQNAKIIVKNIAYKLSHLDVDNAASYLNNADKLIAKLEQFDQALQQQLEPIKNIPYLVFHDAFQYFENRYKLGAVGAIYVSPDSRLSAKRLYNLRKRIKSVRCLFTEPQFEPIPAIIENTSVKQGVLDPLGANLPLTSNGYFTLLQNLANSLSKCLGSS